MNSSKKKAENSNKFQLSSVPKRTLYHTYKISIDFFFSLKNGKKKRKKKGYCHEQSAPSPQNLLILAILFL